MKILDISPTSSSPEAVVYNYNLNNLDNVLIRYEVKKMEINVIKEIPDYCIDLVVYNS